jgi:large subunit ribosomal protein L17
MRHRKREKHLGRNPSHRKALRRNLVCSFLLQGRIQTTKEKAKQTQQFAEKLITLAKENTLAHFRRALALVDDKRVVRRLFREIGPKFSDRPGGYTRLLKLGTDHNRLGDNAPQVLLELVEPMEAEKAAKEAEKPAKGSDKEAERPRDKRKAKKQKDE